MSVFAAIVRRFFAVSAILLLAACGGGGGGGGGGGPGFSVSPGSLTFSTTSASSPTPAPQTITITVTGGTVYLGAFYSGSAIANATFSITGATTAAVTVYPALPASLGAGTHSGTIRIVGCNDFNCTSQVSGSPRDINVSYTVNSLPIEASPSVLSYNYVIGATVPSAQTLNITGGATGWTASASQSWINLSQNSGTGAGPINVGVDPSGLAIGSHTGTITLSTAGGTAVVNVSLNVTQATFTFSPSSLSFGGVSDRDLNDKILQISLNTGANAHSWSIGSATSWLQVIPVSGSVSSTPATVTVRVDATSLTEGTHNGSIVFSAQVNGSTVTGTVPVSLILERHKVLVSDPGVAFASTPSLSKLTRTLRVSSNRGAAIGWSATSSQPWLTATASGTTTGDLVLTADPAGLAVDTVHYATVSVSSSEATVQNTDTVRVGFWVGSTTPSVTTTVTGAFSRIVADPIRPYVYVHSGGTSISVYNIYTGALVTTISSVAAQLAYMVIATDGSRLYAVDATNFTIVPVDLPNFTVGTGWPIGAAVSAYLEYVRSNGVGLVISGNGRFFNASTGSAYSTTFSGGYYGNAVVAASLDGNRLCTLNTGISPYTLTCYPLEFSPASGVLLGTEKTGAWGVGSNGQDVAINADGTRVYVASGSPYNFSVYDPTAAGSSMSVVQSLPGNAYPQNVEVARNGNIFAGSTSFSTQKDLWIYNSNGTELASYTSLSTGPRNLTVSGDGLRVLTPKANLLFTTVGP